MRWALYQRRSLADVQPLEESMASLRQCAQLLGGEVVHEISDAAERAQFRRPGMKSLSKIIENGEVQGVILSDFHKPFRSLSDLAYQLSSWLDRGLRVVVRERSLDTANPRQLLELRDHLAFMLAFEKTARREKGVLSQILRRHPNKRLPKVSDIEIAALLRKGLSQNEIKERICRSGAQIGKGTVNSAVKRVLASGAVSPAEYAKAIAKRGGLRRGGRKTVEKSASEPKKKPQSTNTQRTRRQT